MTYKGHWKWLILKNMKIGYSKMLLFETKTSSSDELFVIHNNQKY